MISRAQQPFQMQRGTLNTDLNLRPQWGFFILSNVRHPSSELDFRPRRLKFHFVYVFGFGKAMNNGICSVFKLLIYACAVCGRLDS